MDDPISRIEAALEDHVLYLFTDSGGHAFSADDIRTLLDRLNAAEAESERLRKSLAAMQGHVLEMCRVFNVPLPEDSLNDARAALENTDAR